MATANSPNPPIASRHGRADRRIGFVLALILFASGATACGNAEGAKTGIQNPVDASGGGADSTTADKCDPVTDAQRCIFTALSSRRERCDAATSEWTLLEVCGAEFKCTESPAATGGGQLQTACEEKQIKQRSLDAADGGATAGDAADEDGGKADAQPSDMANTDTADPASTAKQCIELAQAGSELVRITVNLPEAAAAVPEIKQRMLDAGVSAPLIGDFHYNGHKLLTEYPACAKALDKYRINPGNVGR